MTPILAKSHCKISLFSCKYELIKIAKIGVEANGNDQQIYSNDSIILSTIEELVRKDHLVKKREYFKNIYSL